MHYIPRSRSSSRDAGAREADEDNDGDLSTPLLPQRRTSREKSSSAGLPGVHRYDQEVGAKVGFYSFNPTCREQQSLCLQVKYHARQSGKGVAVRSTYIYIYFTAAALIGERFTALPAVAAAGITLGEGSGVVRSLASQAWRFCYQERSPSLHGTTSLPEFSVLALARVWYKMPIERCLRLPSTVTRWNRLGHS